MGGLHDYINALKNEEVIAYIIEKTGTYPELASVEFLNSLVQKYGITDESAHGHGPKTPSSDDFGINLPKTIENILAYTERATLNKYALASEKYDREEKGVRLFGGLHDFINTLKNEEVIAYIIEKTGTYPELANVNFLGSLVQKYGITDESAHGHGPVTLKAATPSNDEVGINLPKTPENILAYTDRATLNKYALAAEKYDREAKGIKLFGGLHDYIDTLSNEQVIAYILEKTGSYNVNFLSSLVREYGITDESSHGHRQ